MTQAVPLSASFATALPTYPNPHGAAEASISGQSTVNADAPYFSIPAQPVHAIHRDWAALGRAALANIPNINVPAHPLNKEFLYFSEGATHHNSESDVVRSAAMYLIHPINQVLASTPGVSIRCQSEATIGKVRSDITYFRGPTPQNSEFKSFAVVEFKKRGVINSAEFRNTFKYTAPPTDDQAQKTKELAAKQTGESFFQKNSWVLIKQAASYALSHNTPFVALFDWDFLILVRFTRMVAMDNAGDYCELEIIPFNQSSKIRAALLGFLTHAYNHAPVF
jgi:hypothetical protein